MFTNLAAFGGDFLTVLDLEFKKATNVTIASGYASLDIINAYNSEFIRIANSGGSFRLLLGMAFYEGLSQKKYDTLIELNSTLRNYGSDSGVYVTNGRRYHGKVYYFEQQSGSSIYVGSSNFSTSGTKTNIECTLPVTIPQQREEIIRFLEELYSQEYAIKIDLAGNIVSSSKKKALSTIENKWQKLKRYKPETISKDNLPKFIFSLSRVAEIPKSNLNTYFGNGRLNKKTGIITPRPWYEIELIADKDLISQTEYPKGDFIAYTDDGYIIPMRTQGDNYKNIRSKDSLQIFGIWLKGKLERCDALKKYEPITNETLVEYGSDTLVFYKIDEGKYYLEF
jgi:hypothetical protein